MVEIQELSIKWDRDEAVLSLTASRQYGKELPPPPETDSANPPLPALQALRVATDEYLRQFRWSRDVSSKPPEKLALFADRSASSR